jgi:arylsulfatase A-like enzyme
VSFRLGLDTAARNIANLDPQQPFFWFVHTYDVHCPYEPGAAYAAQYATRGPEDRVETEDRCGENDFNTENLTPGQAHYLSDRYDASIREADDLLGVFLARVREAGRLDDTFVVVLSDHGEEFLEHGQIGHRNTQFIESLRIPWIIVGPDLEPAVVARPAGLADVMPTLLDLMGIAIPPKVRGESLVPVLRGRAAGEDPVDRFSENPPKALYSLVRGDRHLILRRRDNEFLLFDWRADPRETENRMGRDPEADAELVETLERQIQRMAVARHRLKPARAPDVDADKQKRLRALGYVE